MRWSAVLLAIGMASLVACAAPETRFIPSQKSALELRSAQTRVVEGDRNTVLRAVVATLQDLGYRITRAEPSAGTISATRLTGLRLATVVTEQGPSTTVVRANATVLQPGTEAQVDSVEFYQRNFFVPLSVVMGRDARPVRDDEAVPDALRPVAEPLPGGKAQPVAPAERDAPPTTPAARAPTS